MRTLTRHSKTSVGLSLSGEAIESRSKFRKKRKLSIRKRRS